MRILLDTNIILRNAVASDPQHPHVHAALQRLIRNGWELCVGVQNLIEFWVVATRPVNVNGLGLTPGETAPEIKAMRKAYTLLRDPDDLFEQWQRLCVDYLVSGRPAHDTRLVALMMSCDVDHLLTLNPSDFIRYSEITCLTPDAV